jgi:hypothetical protein
MRAAIVGAIGEPPVGDTTDAVLRGRAGARIVCRLGAGR